MCVRACSTSAACPGCGLATLTPNLRGAQAAFEARVHQITVKVAVTQAHSLANKVSALDAGFDLQQSAVARACLERGRPGEPLYGMVPQGGLPKGFRYAREGV